MSRGKRSRRKATKHIMPPELQRRVAPAFFVEHGPAADFYWGYTRLVGTLELMAVEQPDPVERQLVIEFLADIARRLEEKLGAVLGKTWSLRPGVTVLEAVDKKSA